MIFVDTSAWFACIIPTDPNHQIASRWTEENHEILITTDYVVDETLTLLKVRGQTRAALGFGKAIFSGNLASVHFLTEEQVRQAWAGFVQYQDKEWSFTDMTSKVVIEAFGIEKAFAFDRHFGQFGSVQVVPVR